MRARLFSVLILLLCCFYSYGKELEEFLTDSRKIFWTLKPEQCSVVLGVRFRPQDRYNNAMRYSSKDNQKYITFNKRVIPEIIFYFAKRELQSVTISLYNRGDNGIIDEKSFSNLNSQAEKFISDFSGDAEPVSETRKFDKFRIESLIWQDKNCDYVIRRNKRGKYPEYLQLIIYPAGKAKKLREALRTAADKNQLQLNLNIQPDGDHYLDIPMVNQGTKGYCVDSTVERIMKYYGSRVDQQIIAQLAKSDSYYGTNLRTIINVLDKNKSKLKINVEKNMTDDIITFENLQKFNQTYNNFAKKQKRNRVNFNDFCFRKGRYKRLDIKGLISNYEYDIFCDARNKNKRDTAKFDAIVKDTLSKGIPLAWCTFTFDNTKPGQKVGRFGFHMRIINGFNPKTNQIIYTDSWGKGHEKKHISLAEARAITLMLLKITPK